LKIDEYLQLLFEGKMGAAKPIIKPINTSNYYKIGIMIGLIWSNSTDLNR